MAATVQRPTDPVLIVEDNRDVQDAFAFILKRAGFRVRTAVNGADALVMLASGVEPCVILLDYYMPVMSGRDFRLLQLELGIQLDVPVVLFSSDHHLETEDLKLTGLFQPLEFDQLVSVVERACGHDCARLPS